LPVFTQYTCNGFSLTGFPFDMYNVVGYKTS